jgi:hypothetical protein
VLFQCEFLQQESERRGKPIEIRIIECADGAPKP